MKQELITEEDIKLLVKKSRSDSSFLFNLLLFFSLISLWWFIRRIDQDRFNDWISVFGASLIPTSLIIFAILLKLKRGKKSIRKKYKGTYKSIEVLEVKYVDGSGDEIIKLELSNGEKYIPFYDEYFTRYYGVKHVQLETALIDGKHIDAIPFFVNQ